MLFVGHFETCQISVVVREIIELSIECCWLFSNEFCWLFSNEFLLVVLRVISFSLIWLFFSYSFLLKTVILQTSLLQVLTPMEERFHSIFELEVEAIQLDMDSTFFCCFCYCFKKR